MLEIEEKKLFMSIEQLLCFFQMRAICVKHCMSILAYSLSVCLHVRICKMCREQLFNCNKIKVESLKLSLLRCVTKSGITTSSMLNFLQ